MEYFGILVVIAVLGIGYWVYTDTNNSTPVVETKPTPKATKISRPVLNKLTKAQLAEKGKQLGIDVDTKQLKKKIGNEVFKAQ